MRARVPNITKTSVAQELFYIRRGLRVVGSIRLGNATALKRGTGKGRFHAFFIVSNQYKNSY